MQEAFQKGFEDVYGKTDGIILPERDIDRSLGEPGAISYKAVVDGQMAGGAVVVIDEATQHNHLHLLYVKSGIQAKGIEFAIWTAIEKLHPHTKVWETCTPYAVPQFFQNAHASSSQIRSRSTTSSARLRMLFMAPAQAMGSSAFKSSVTDSAAAIWAMILSRRSWACSLTWASKSHSWPLRIRVLYRTGWWSFRKSR